MSEERALARVSQRMATDTAAQAAILRDGRLAKSAVADFDTLALPKSGKPDFGGRPPQDEGFYFLHTRGMTPQELRR